MKARALKILVCGDGVAPTGFATVLHSIIKYLPKKDYKIYWLAVNYHGDPHDYPYKIYPASMRNRMDAYGLERLQEFAPLDLDIIFILNDAWIVDSYLEVLKLIYKDKKMPKIVVYTPVDAKNHDGMWYRHFDIVTKTVTYTQFGKKEIAKATKGIVDPLVIPHGIDKTNFYRMESKEKVKKLIYPTRPDLWKDSFIVFNGNRNQPRKKIDISLLAFAMFAENKPDNVCFYYHGGVIDAGVDVLKLASRYGYQRKNRLILTNLDKGAQRVPVKKLNEFYNATDVGINTSIGEGWGLVSTEHAITGAPQIMPMHSANEEIFKNIAILVQPAVPLIMEATGTTGMLVRAEDMATGLELLYNDKQLREDISKDAITKFSSPEYSWENIAKTWDTLFKEIVG